MKTIDVERFRKELPRFMKDLEEMLGEAMGLMPENARRGEGVGAEIGIRNPDGPQVRLIVTLKLAESEEREGDFQ
jgi:hypothetical protein